METSLAGPALRQPAAPPSMAQRMMVDMSFVDKAATIPIGRDGYVETVVPSMDCNGKCICQTFEAWVAFQCMGIAYTRSGHTRRQRNAQYSLTRRRNGV